MPDEEKKNDKPSMERPQPPKPERILETFSTNEPQKKPNKPDQENS